MAGHTKPHLPWRGSQTRPAMPRLTPGNSGRLGGSSRPPTRLEAGAAPWGLGGEGRSGWAPEPDRPPREQVTGSRQAQEAGTGPQPLPSFPRDSSSGPCSPSAQQPSVQLTQSVPRTPGQWGTCAWPGSSRARWSCHAPAAPSTSEAPQEGWLDAGASPPDTLG